MRQILLLAAIYSLVINQSKKNAKQIVPGMRESIKKAASLSFRSDARQIVSNDFGFRTKSAGGVDNTNNILNARWTRKR